MVRPVDQNGDYVIGDEDRVVLGNSNPHWTLGWTNTLSWKGIEAGITLYGRMGYMVSGLGNGLTGEYNIIKKQIIGHLKIQIRNFKNRFIRNQMNLLICWAIVMRLLLKSGISLWAIISRKLFVAKWELEI